MEVMGKDTVLTALRELTGWSYDDGEISKTFDRSSFRQAAELFNRMAEAAERADHHPDVKVSANGSVTVTLRTHAAGGVTREDIKLATTFEGMAREG